jgi:hypothetical protein
MSVISQITNSPGLGELKKINPSKWVKKLKKRDITLAHLFNTIVHLPHYQQNTQIKKISSDAQKILNGMKLSKRAKEIFSVAKNYLKIKAHVPPKKHEKSHKQPAPLKTAVKKSVSKSPVSHDGLINIGSTCWMNSLLQLFRTTKQFDWIHTPALSRIKGNNLKRRQALVRLQETLHSSIERLRQNKGLSREHLATLYREIQAAHIIEKPGAQDAPAVLEALKGCFIPHQGQNDLRLARIQQVGIGENALAFEDGQENFSSIPIFVRQNNTSSSELLESSFFQVRDGENLLRRKITSFPPMAQVNFIRTGNCIPNILPQIDLGKYSAGASRAPKIYTLKAVLRYSGGHYTYLVREKNGTWKLYDDSRSSILQNGAARKEINKSGYACFYEVN